MQLYSTNSPGKLVSLKEAVFQGLPPDNGLYMPYEIPKLPASFFDTIEDQTFQGIAFNVANALMGDAVPQSELRAIIKSALDFEVPIRALNEQIYTLELYHGPTLAFKDFGARFMARLMSYLLRGSSQKPCILVATSGDTGSAVAHGFYEVPGIDVVILYPSGKVSQIQEQQLTTIGANVTALEVEGTFDDCQQLVKAAFLDPELQEHKNLTSANSINIARLIPQSFYYFEIYARLKYLQKPLVCAVPSGNFGNLMAGLMAKRMGLPLAKFIAANNDNRVFYDYLQSGAFRAKPSIATISNAMDVGNPSNFVRILNLYDQDYQSLSKDITGYTFNDDLTRKAIHEVMQQYQYLLDPHGAVGYLALKEYLKSHPQSVGVFLGTAHPVKFLDVVQPLIPDPIPIPARLQDALDQSKKSRMISNSFEALKAYLLT